MHMNTFNIADSWMPYFVSSRVESISFAATSVLQRWHHMESVFFPSERLHYKAPLQRQKSGPAQSQPVSAASAAVSAPLPQMAEIKQKGAGVIML
jgi:hypothetical protein